MKPTQLFFIALLLCFMSSICLAQTVGHKTYDYITIVATNAKPDLCNISINGEKYESIDLPKTKDWHDYTEVIKIVKKYESEGYEVFASNMFGQGLNSAIYFLLRKERKK